MKRIFALLLTLCLLMGLTACGSGFKNEEEMKAALIGTWTTADQTAQFTISATTVTYRYHFLDGSSTDLNMEHPIREWNYKKGELLADQTHPITVNKDGSSLVWQDTVFLKGGKLAMPETELKDMVLASNFSVGGGLYTINFGKIVNDTRAIKDCTVTFERYEDADKEVQEKFSSVLDRVQGDKYFVTFSGSVNRNPQAADVLPDYQEKDTFAIYLVGTPIEETNCMYWHSKPFTEMAILWNAYFNSYSYY